MNDATVLGLLHQLSEAFRLRRVDDLLAQFSAGPTATYAGSEAGETATGVPALRRLFTDVFGREEAYSFRLPQVMHDDVGGRAWLLAEGAVLEHRRGQATQSFPYRITGVLVREAGAWRWALLTGSEPAVAAEATTGNEAEPIAVGPA